jgi:hypothetical protein
VVGGIALRGNKTSASPPTPTGETTVFRPSMACVAESVWSKSHFACDELCMCVVCIIFSIFVCAWVFRCLGWGCVVCISECVYMCVCVCVCVCAAYWVRGVCGGCKETR